MTTKTFIVVEIYFLNNELNPSLLLYQSVPVDQWCIFVSFHCCRSADREKKMTLHVAGWSRAVSSFYFHLIYTTAGGHADWTEAQRAGGRREGGDMIEDREGVS